MANEVVDYLLDGLERYLELERELGVRAVPCDSSLLVPPPAKPVPTPVQPPAPAPAPVPPRPAAKPVSSTMHEPKVRETTGTEYDFVFLHDRPLSPAAEEMMTKILAKLGRDLTSAPVIVDPPIPKAKIYVFLGTAALRRYMPNLRLVENAWNVSPKGKPVLYVRSPEDILRFKTVTPAIQKIKLDMWHALRSILQHLGQTE